MPDVTRKRRSVQAVMLRLPNKAYTPETKVYKDVEEGLYDLTMQQLSSLEIMLYRPARGPVPDKE